MNDEIQHIISRESQIGQGIVIKTITDFLARCQETSGMAKTDKHFKTKETKSLIDFIETEKLWYSSININDFIAEGAEQKVFIKNSQSVLKLNDSIYYLSWIDYFQNLLLHNYYFSDTFYTFLGFYQSENILYAVVEQPFVKANEKTNLDFVKLFLTNNGFENTRNND
jgi:Serine/Threonine/Tyrosine Kinase found in polyvalent proteins